MVTLLMPNRPRIEWKRSNDSYPSKVISYIRVQRLIDKGFLDYLAFIQDTIARSSLMEYNLVVSEFMDIFPTDLPRAYVDRDINFAIDLEIGTKPISILAYHMAPPRSKKLID